MTNTSRRQALRAPEMFVPASWVAAALSVALALGVAHGSVPTSNELGVHFKVVKSGPTTTVEIRMTPRRDFDSVTVEAASGVASLTPPCGFKNVTAAAATPYVCRVDVTGKSMEAAMTLNVVARRAVPGGTVPVMEMHHFSIKNPAFAIPQKRSAASHHDVADPAATHN